ncbi:hypothetical protein QBC44DRAFT_307849 [Cladorrhinum sp. PSN332]|nr:hypothetical protein QBC44DRAFT_307849 [Cladorrhinum sp. PSN332]
MPLASFLSACRLGAGGLLSPLSLIGLSNVLASPLGKMSRIGRWPLQMPTMAPATGSIGQLAIAKYQAFAFWEVLSYRGSLSVSRCLSILDSSDLLFGACTSRNGTGSSET